MSVVHLHDRSVARPVAGPVASDAPRARAHLAAAVQALAIVGAMLLGVVLALMLPGTARGAGPTPAGTADSYDAPHAGVLVVDAAHGVLANDTGAGLTAELWTDANHGEVALTSDGSFSYTPSEPANRDAFAYLPTDSIGVAADPVKVHLRFANESPMCTGVQLQGQPAGVEVEIDLRDACVDGDGDTLVFEYQRPDLPNAGAFDATPGGSITFLAPDDWGGTVAVLFTASDGRSTSMPTLAAIGVIPAE
jgi:hypothetical protein